MSFDHFPVSLTVARRAIARAVLGNRELTPQLGNVVLHKHQLSAAARLLGILDTSRGAMLCDDVGLGKTFTALAVARVRGSFAVVAPASLCRAWRDALARANMSATFIRSHESLGRKSIVLPDVSLLIVDEAHGFRNPATQRYASLASACVRSSVLLVSATPIHNLRNDLCALVALFAGSAAYDLDDAALSRLLVRRTAADSIAIPAVVTVRVEAPPLDPGVTAKIRDLPAPVPARDGAIAAALVAGSLLRAWASSGSALANTVRRRLARGNALLSALREGRYPSRGELRLWALGDDSMQLAFAEIAASSHEGSDDLMAALDRHLTALEGLLALVMRSDDTRSRAETVRQCRLQHRGEKMIAFTTFEATARAIYSQLKRDGGVALMSARGAEVVGGRVSRATAIQAFAPRASQSRDPPAALAIDLLVTTDLLGEGVNLQDAAVLIHLDFPWTGARIDQRVGRLARLGSTHRKVTAYEFIPDPLIERELRVLDAIVRKRRVAAALLGDRTTIGTVGENEAIVATLERWRAECCAMGGGNGFECSGRVATAAVMGCSYEGALVTWSVAGVTALACVRRGVVTTAPRDVRCALAAIDQGTECEVSSDDARTTLETVDAWMEQSRGERCAGMDMVRENNRGSVRRRAALRRLERGSRAAPLTLRLRSASREAAIRRAFSIPQPIAVEDELIAGAFIDVPTVAHENRNAPEYAVVIFVLPSPAQSATAAC